ncbi:MAG: circularly permuted type 2 ATP-grasp protein [Solirubrobacteraceae bacterium]
MPLSMELDAMLAGLGDPDLRALAREIRAELRDQQVNFGSGPGSEFRVDPLPCVIESSVWDALVPALRQRARALESFVCDVYGGERQIVGAGIVPETAIATAEHYEPRIAELPAPLDGMARIGVAGFDLVREQEGPFQVLEDNVRTPSGLAYALAARRSVCARLPQSARASVRSLESAVESLRGVLRAASGEQRSVVVLSDGPANCAWYEHRTLAALLDIPLVMLGELRVRDGRLYAWIEGREHAIDIVYRRTDEDRLLDRSTGAPSSVGEALLGPLAAGTLTCVNGFGTGLADDKLLHAYVEPMIEFYLAERPLIRGVPTYDLADPQVLGLVLDRLAELVIKPRSGHGGSGVVIGPRAEPDTLELTAQAITARPSAFVAQETVQLSREPTLCADGEIELRHVDLRPFSYNQGATGGVEIAPGGLTRVALERGSMIVNSSRGGGAKDTWVLGS